MVTGAFSQHLYFQGTADPAVYAEVDIIGAKSAEKNITISAALAAFFKDRLGFEFFRDYSKTFLGNYILFRVQSDRVFFVTHDVPAHLWGYEGSTVAKLFE